MKISKVLDKFIDYQSVLGLTDKTLLHNKNHIKLYISWLGDIDMKNLTYKKHYEKYVLYLRSKRKQNKEKLSSRTIYTYLECIKTFFKYSFENGYMKEDIYSQIKLPKFKKKTIQILSESQIIDIMTYYDKNTFVGIRNTLILSLMLDCGLRVSEVVNLTIMDFSVENRTIKVDVKGQKERLVPLTNTTLFLFNRYLEEFDNKFLPLDRLFVNSMGFPISVNAVKCFMRRMKYNLDIYNLHPHLLRHTFATMFLLNGGDPLHLQIILGHTTLDMTTNYIHIANQMRISEQMQFSPLTKIPKVLNV